MSEPYDYSRAWQREKLARQQAAQHIRNHPHLIQLQRTGALADLYIVGGQYRRKTLP